MSSSSAAPQRSPIAERIRARLGEMKLTESKASEALGWHRSVLSTILRRIDAGGGLNTDTLTELEKLLGKPAQWILTGVELAGVRLRDCDGWADAARVARERYGLTEEQVERVGEATFPTRPRFIEAATIRAIADLL